jgi:nucleoside-diphosphate-sugar epimerase
MLVVQQTLPLISDAKGNQSMRTVLITGAEGLIGSCLRQALAGTYDLRLVTWQPQPDCASIVADVADPAAMTAACQGVQSVIHLAGSASVDTPWEHVLHNNIEGTYAVFTAALQAGVDQVIYASSNHAVGGYEFDGAPAIYQTTQPVIDERVSPRPDSLYGVSKCFGEALGRYYSDRHGLHVICLRIGAVLRSDTPVAQPEPWMPMPQVAQERIRAVWLSQRDCAQLVERCLEHPEIPFDIFYGVSNNTHRFWDIDHARAVLGYAPQDGA